MFGAGDGSVDPLRGVSTARVLPQSVAVAASTSAIDGLNTRRRREHIQLDADFHRQLVASNVGYALRNQLVLDFGQGYTAPLTVENLEICPTPDTVRIGVEALARFPGQVLPGTATLRVYAPSTGVSDATAQAQGLYYETLVDNGSNTNTVILAPHGGNIEAGTDTLAAALKVALDAVGKTCTVWGGKGYGFGAQGSYERHHISSVDIDPRLNPMLNSIFARGFARAISPHGQSAANRIDIGGPTAVSAFIDAYVAALHAHPDLASQTIAHTEDSEIQGTNGNNLGNRMAPHYVQIEMGPECRASPTMLAAIASVTATVYTPL